MNSVERAIVGSNGADMLATEPSGGSHAVELSGKNDGSVWVSDGAGRQLPYVLLNPGLMEPGRRMEVVTLSGEEISGTYVGISDLGLILSADQNIVVPRRNVGKVALPEAASLPVVSFASIGRAFVRYRTPNVTAQVRTLIEISTSPDTMSAGSTVELLNLSEKAWNLKDVSVVTHPVSLERKRDIVTSSLKMSARPAPPSSSSSMDDAFTATMKNIRLGAHSTFSNPLRAWKFDHDIVTTVAVRYDGWSRTVHLSDPQTQALVTSDDDRLFPGGPTTVVIDAAEVSDVVTSRLARGDRMLVSLFPNQRVSARIEMVRISVTPLRVTGNGAKNAPANGSAEVYELIDFDFVAEVRRARAKEVLLVGLDEEVINDCGLPPLRTKDGAVYYLMEVPASGITLKAHFRIRVPFAKR